MRQIIVTCLFLISHTFLQVLIFLNRMTSIWKQVVPVPVGEIQNTFASILLNKIDNVSSPSMFMDLLTLNNSPITWSLWMKPWNKVILINNYLQIADIYLAAIYNFINNEFESPPQEESVEAIDSVKNAEQIYRAEYFGRNVAAAGNCEQQETFIML
jgi:hypothetical protein